jgi:COMPASS component SWD3
MVSGKVLILDENQMTRMQLREFLPKGQYEIQEASDGELGLSLIQQERANIRFIILDSALPKVNGWDVVQQLQADTELQRIPLVMMTELTDAPLSSHPMVEFLQKPFEKKELKTVVKNAIGKAISVYQNMLSDREEESFLRDDRNREDLVVEESSLTSQNPDRESTIDLDNMFESFVESERDRSEFDEEEGIDVRESEERELDFSFDTTGTEEAIDKEEMSALGLNFPALDMATIATENLENDEEKLEFESEMREREEIIAIDKITSFDRDREDREATFSFDTTGSDETIDTREIDILRKEDSQVKKLAEENLDLASANLTSSLEELNSGEFQTNEISNSESNSKLEIDEASEIDKFPSLDIDLSTEDLTPEIDEFPSLDIDLSTEDLTPEIDEFPSLDIALSTEDFNPEIDEFPSLDINLSTEDFNSEIDELKLEVSSENKLEPQSNNRDESAFENQLEALQENLDILPDEQELNRQDLESTKPTENLNTEELDKEINELSSLDADIFTAIPDKKQVPQQQDNEFSPFELEELSNETAVFSDEIFPELAIEESATAIHEWNEQDFEAEYSSEESEALIDESFADLGTEVLLDETVETHEDNFEAEYSSEESEALIDESFADLGTEVLLDETVETHEDNFEAEYSSEESEALIDESFADLGAEALLDENELETRLVSRDRLAPTSPFVEKKKEIESFTESDELSIVSDDFPVELEKEIEPYNTSDEDIRKDYHHNQPQDENFFDPSLTLNPTEEIQYPAEDIFSTQIDLQEDESEELPENLFTPPPPWEEQNNNESDLNESDSIFDPSLQLAEETIAYSPDVDNIFPPLGETDLFEAETPQNEPLVNDPSSSDSFSVEDFDRELTDSDRQSENEEGLTILEDKRSNPIALPETSTNLEESQGEHTIFEDKRSREIAQPSIEPTEETDSLDSEREFTVLEDKQSIDLTAQPFNLREETDPDLISLQAENPLQLNKVFTESDRETEISHLVNLSGFDDVLMRYQSTVEDVKISALKEAFDYDEPGYRLIINALREEASEIRQTAEKLLIEYLKKPRIQVLPPHENWTAMQCLHTLRGHSYWVQDVAIAPDGRTIVSASKDGTIKLWDILTGREMRTLHGHEAAVLSVAISADGERLISCGTDNAIKIWSLDTGMELNSILSKSHNIYVLSVSPNGKTLVSASADNTIKPKYDGGLEAFLNRIPSRRVNALLSLIGLLKRSPAIKIWDLDRGKPKGNFRGYSRGVTDLAISPKGDKVVSGSRDRTLKIWDFKTGKNLDTLWGHNDEIRSVAISPDGKTIISGSRDRTIKIWDMQSGHVLRTLRGHGQSVTSVAVSPDGTIIVSGSRDSSIKIWDFNTGEFINTLLGHTDLVRSVAIAADGKTIVSGSRDNTIKIWGNVYQ